MLVASSAPLDQYIVEHPDYFFGRSPEQAHINPDNLEILLSHLKCAAFELPDSRRREVRQHDVATAVPVSRGRSAASSITPAMLALGQRQLPRRCRQPARGHQRQLRGRRHHRRPRIIAEVDFPAALTTLHEKAIYLHEARQYQVEKLDYDGRKAYVRQRRLRLLHRRDRLHAGERARAVRIAACRQRCTCRHGEVRVNRQIVGFKKIKFYTLENVGAGNLSLPEQEMHTTAFWLHFPTGFFADFAGLLDSRSAGRLARRSATC